MSKAKNFTALVIPDLTGSKAELVVKGEIDTGNDKSKPGLTKRVPQGFNPTELLLEASPVNDGGQPENFQEVSYSEDVTDNRYRYSSIKIFVKGSDEVLVNKIEVVQAQSVA